MQTKITTFAGCMVDSVVMGGVSDDQDAAEGLRLSVWRWRVKLRCLSSIASPRGDGILLRKGQIEYAIVRLDYHLTCLHLVLSSDVVAGVCFPNLAWLLL